MAFKSTQVVSCIVSQLAVKITGRPLSWPSFTLICYYFFHWGKIRKSDIRRCLIWMQTMPRQLHVRDICHIYSITFMGLLPYIPNPIREWMNNGWLKIEMLVQYMFFTLACSYFVSYFLRMVHCYLFLFLDRMFHCCLIILRSSDSALICAHGPIRYIYLFIPQ